MVLDSVEVDEAMYPLLVEERRIVEDSLGPGRWNGAPAVGGTYRSLTGDVVVAYVGDGGTFPAKGVLGGGAGANSGTWKRHPDGRVERMPDFHQETYKFGEAVVYRGCAGGGYGTPRSRDPERVARDVARKWLSPEKARETYGVAVQTQANGVDVAIDWEATRKLRA